MVRCLKCRLWSRIDRIVVRDIEMVSRITARNVHTDSYDWLQGLEGLLYGVGVRFAAPATTELLNRSLVAHTLAVAGRLEEQSGHVCRDESRLTISANPRVRLRTSHPYKRAGVCP